MCATPIFQHAAAQHMTGRVFASLCKLLRLLAPVPAAARAAAASPAAQCWAVLSLSELLAGFLLPSLVLAAQESRCFVEWWAHWQRSWQLVQRRRQQRRAALQTQLCTAGTSTGAAEAVEGARMSAAAEVAAARCGTLPPHVHPPGWLAASAYRALHAGMCLHDPADWMVTAFVGVFLLCSAWQAILLAMPEGLA